MCLPLSRLNLKSKVAALGGGAFRSLQRRCGQPFRGKSPNIRHFAEDAAGIPEWQAPCICSFQSMHQEDKHMTRTDLEMNQEGMWRMLVFEQRTTLTLAVEMQLRCQLSPEQILTKTAMALEGSHHDS